MKTSELKLTSAFVALAIAQAAYAAPQDTNANRAEAAAKEEIILDEIVVTATRRNAGVNSIPLSISALAPETLANRGIRSVDEIASVSPGLSIINNNDGEETLSVRGIVAFGSVATTAFYIDETPISQLAGGTFSPRYFDIERVEVLRGPQGTLYGASALGGAVRIITTKPNSSRFEGAFRAEGSTTRFGTLNRIADGAINIPIVTDLLALRVTGFYERQSGWIRNVQPTLSQNPADYVTADGNTGIAYAGLEPGNGRRVGGQEIYGGRAALRAEPSDAITLTGSYSWQKRRNEGGNVALVAAGLGFDGSELRQAGIIDGFRSLTSQLANFTVEADLGLAKLTSATSYEWNRESSLADSTGLFGDAVLALEAVPINAAGRSGLIGETLQNKQSFSQEVRLVSQGDGALSWIVGGFYNRTRLRQPQNLVILGLNTILSEQEAPQNSFGRTNLFETRREISVFGEVSYKITDQLAATLGLRRYDVRTGNESSVSGIIAQGRSSVPFRTVPDRGFTYKALINYKPADDILFFAGYTTGYRPGGINQPRLPGDNFPDGFTSDRLAQYELGWKTRFLDRAITFNGAAFYIDWRDIPTEGIAPSTISFVFNGPRARILGGEIEIALRPTKGMDFTIGATILDAKYSASFPEQNIARGDLLPEVPRYSVNAAFNYEWSIGGNANARIGANVVHVSRRQGRPEFSPDSPSSLPDLSSSLPGFATAGLSAGIGFGDFDISIFVRNLFDERGLVGNRSAGNEIIDGNSLTLRTLSYTQPRTIGASFQVKF